MKIIDECKVGDEIVFNQPKKYKYVGRAGRGGTGKAIVIEDTMLGKKLVSKKYEPIHEEDKQEFYSRFVDEIKIMFNINHNNIIRIYDYYLYPEFYTGYIMMEYINGLDISEYFRRKDGEKINSIFIQIIQAFAYLESKKILHRDIRSGNIMIDEHDDVKVIDFGFGKQIENISDENASVFLNWPVATFPNEIHKGIYNTKTEIYFLGCLLSDIILENNLKGFKYQKVLDEMSNKNDNKRINSFSEINQMISFMNINSLEFTSEEKTTYRSFMSSLYSAISSFEIAREFETNIEVLLDKLNDIIVKNSLEIYVLDATSVISCFILSRYRYRMNSKIDVDDLQNFYNFLKSSSEYKRTVVMENIYNKLSTIEVLFEFKFDDNDEELPFN